MQTNASNAYPSAVSRSTSVHIGTEGWQTPVDVLHAHYLPISNRFDYHGNRVLLFFCGPISKRGGETRTGDTLDINSIRARCAVQRLNELTTGIAVRKQLLLQDLGAG